MSAPRTSFAVAAARAGLPSSCSASCSRFKVAPAEGPASSAAASGLRAAWPASARFSATTNRACGSRISWTSRLGDKDGARLAAVACGGAACCAPAGAAGVAAVELLPSADCSVWRSTISAALRSGTPLGGDCACRQRRLEEDSGLLERRLDVAAVEVLIEAGLLRQHLRNRRLQFRRQIAGGNRRAEIGKQRRQAVLFGDRGLRGCGDGYALQRRQHVLR